MCDRLIRIYKYLSNEIDDYRNDGNYKKDLAFLNYWINWKMHEGKFNQNTSVKDFIDHIESHNIILANLDIINPPIYDIEKNDLYKMNILYSLYEKYSKLNDIIKNKFEQHKQSLSTLSTACCLDYIKASYLCNDDNMNNNPIFCKKLDTFKLKHDALHTEVISKDSEYSDQFIKLSECHNNKIITTAVTGTVVGLIPLLGVLYKFTPMGQVLRSKMGILNNNISNTDEDTTNISLMEQENEPIKFQQGTYNIKYQFTLP
ncbi:Plasmodium vivax Vir protein, putative [Plasmodium vivax]|uniref:Vir protein, putative n=1 Tax=Plasmodium vivax TaxID=5855 RepID=A0A1G4E780_PLAVI|nr:Plasmodium vivax Vir protein, putative [Plasmodium vivax]